MKKRKLNETGDTNAVKKRKLKQRGTQMLFELKLFFDKCAAGSVPEGSGCPGMGGRRLAGGGRPGVAGKGSLGTSAPSFHSASKRAPQGPGSRHGSGRGHRTSNTRTRAGEVVLPGGRVHMGCLLPTPRTPSRRKRLRACLWRFGPVLEFGLERCPRLWCGCWPWFPGAPRGGFRLVWLVGGRTAGLPGGGPDCSLRRGRRPLRPPPSTPSPADGPWCGLSWATEVPVDRRVSSLVVLSVWEVHCGRGWRSGGCVPGVGWRTPGEVRGGLGSGHGVPERGSAVG
jgi:hypothetical protein